MKRRVLKFLGWCGVIVVALLLLLYAGLFAFISQGPDLESVLKEKGKQIGQGEWLVRGGDRAVAAPASVDLTAEQATNRKELVRMLWDGLDNYGSGVLRSGILPSELVLSQDKVAFHAGKSTDELLCMEREGGFDCVDHRYVKDLLMLNSHEHAPPPQLLDVVAKLEPLFFDSGLATLSTEELPPSFPVLAENLHPVSQTAILLAHQAGDSEKLRRYVTVYVENAAHLDRLDQNIYQRPGFLEMSYFFLLLAEMGVLGDDDLAAIQQQFRDLAMTPEEAEAVHARNVLAWALRAKNDQRLLRPEETFIHNLTGGMSTSALRLVTKPLYDRSIDRVAAELINGNRTEGGMTGLNIATRLINNERMNFPIAIDTYYILEQMESRGDFPGMPLWRQREAQYILAVARYRVRTGEWPASDTQLGEDLLPAEAHKDGVHRYIVEYPDFEHEVVEYAGTGEFAVFESFDLSMLEGETTEFGGEIKTAVKQFKGRPLFLYFDEQLPWPEDSIPVLQETAMQREATSKTVLFLRVSCYLVPDFPEIIQAYLQSDPQLQETTP